MKRETLKWCYDHFTMHYFHHQFQSTPEYRDYRKSGEALFASFTPEQNDLYLRYEAAENALYSLQQEQFFYDVFRFSRELLG